MEILQHQKVCKLLLHPVFNTTGHLKHVIRKIFNGNRMMNSIVYYTYFISILHPHYFLSYTDYLTYANTVIQNKHTHPTNEHTHTSTLTQRHTHTHTH